MMKEHVCDVIKGATCPEIKLHGKCACHCTSCYDSRAHDKLKNVVTNSAQIIIDRLEILRDSIARHDWDSATWEHDRVLRAATKLKREAETP